MFERELMTGMEIMGEYGTASTSKRLVVEGKGGVQGIITPSDLLGAISG